MIPIYIDTKEKKQDRINTFKRIMPEMKSAHLEIGDIVSGNVCIEIKDEDLIGSISSGKLFKQCAQMKANYENCYVFVIRTHIGILQYKKENNINFPMDSIIGAFNSIRSRQKVHVIQFENYTFAAQTAKSIIEKCNDGKQFYINPKRREATSKDSQINILVGYPSISEKRAKLLLEHFKTIENFNNASIEELCEVNKIGTKIATEIHKIKNYEYEGNIDE